MGKNWARCETALFKEDSTLLVTLDDVLSVSSDELMGRWLGEVCEVPDRVPSLSQLSLRQSLETSERWEQVNHQLVLFDSNYKVSSSRNKRGYTARKQQGPTRVGVYSCVECVETTTISGCRGRPALGRFRVVFTDPSFSRARFLLLRLGLFSFFLTLLKPRLEVSGRVQR